MAESTSTMLISNGSGDQVSHNKGGGAADPFAAMPILNIPVIDLSSCISSESSPERTQELEKLRLALSSFGCVQLKNHGMTSSFLDQVYEAGKHFFALPMEEKVKYSEGEGGFGGYMTWTISQSHTLDKPWVDRLYLNVHPEDMRKLNLWPRNPQTFREILHEYSTEIKFVADNLLKAMAVSLELAEKRFLEQFGEKYSMLATFNFYPPCLTSTTAHLNLGSWTHSDGSGITILLQDNQVDGFQLLKDNQWFRVPSVPHTLLINIGDQVEIMSNGTFMAPLHKVMKNPEKERMTVAVFCMPQSDKEIGPFEELISKETPRLYKTVVNYADILRTKGGGPETRGLDKVKL